MEVQEALLRRRSVRKFTPEVVNDTDIQTLLHAAMSGPSACNCTPWEFYVVTNQDILARLRKATRYSGIVAPLAIIVAGDLTRALPEPRSSFWVHDCSAATENILLRAVDLGLGAVWCGIYPDENAVRTVSDILHVAPPILPLNILYIGHPAETPEPRDQYQEKFVHFIR